jgi:8-oxo-dGTP diphosphatase
MTTLCYLEREGKVLLLHRTKKKHDENGGKYIGVGGKFEAGESPEDCMRREVFEETGYVPTAHRYRGIVTFVSDEWGTEYMHLFSVTDFEGEEKVCDEGDLCWVEKERVLSLPTWEGDRIFLALLWEERPFFSLKLSYEGDKLVFAALNGKELEL